MCDHFTFTVLPSSLNLTIDSTPAGSELYNSLGSVSGTVSDDSYTVWVNGVEVTGDYWDDGTAWHWQMDNAPIRGLGTATFDAAAYAPGVNGSNGGLSGSGGAQANTAAANVSTDPEMPAEKIISEYHFHLVTSSTSHNIKINRKSGLDLTKAYYNYLQPGLGNQWAHCYTGAVDTVTHDNQVGDTDISGTWSGSGTSATETDTDPYGDETTHPYTGNTLDTGVPELESCFVGGNAFPVTHYYADVDFQIHSDIGGIDDAHSVTTESMTARTTLKLYTGGKALVNRQNLFCFHFDHANVEAYEALGSTWEIDDLDLTSLTVLKKHPGTDGNIWLTLPDNEAPTVTVTAPRKHYTADFSQQKYKLVITDNGTPLDPARINKTNCAGGHVIFTLDGLPGYDHYSAHWGLPQKFVNEKWQHEQWVPGNPYGGGGYYSPYGSVNYRVNPDLLTNLPATDCWFYNGQGGKVSVGADLWFPNGQKVFVSADGKIALEKASIDHVIINAFSGVNMFTNPAGDLVAIAFDGFDNNGGQAGNGMDVEYWVKRPDHFSGNAFITQLVKIDAHWNANYLPGTYQVTTDGNYWLDTDNPYHGTNPYFSLNTNPVRAVSFNDSPDLPAPGTGFKSYAEDEDDFNQYLQFQPDSENSIPVTIGIFTWGWHGKATKGANGVWGLDISTDYGPTLNGSDGFPEWETTYTK